MPAPTFLCIGSQKCGTTWLASNVRQHPEVCIGNQKELHFFDRLDHFGRGFTWYEAQFECTLRTKAIGEFSPNYFWTAGGTPAVHQNHALGVAKRVADAYPHLRLIVMLRDPVERAVSGYFHNLRARRYRLGLGILEVAKAWPGIVELGRYDVNLAQWFALFPREAFLILIYEEDVKPDEAKPRTLHRVFEHIGVDPSFVPDDVTVRKNTRDTHFDMRLRHAPSLAAKVLRRLPDGAKSWPLWDIPVGDEERAALAAEYAPGVARLETMLGRKLPWSTSGLT